MRELFDGGFASPFDENEFGKGIFEVSTNMNRWLHARTKFSGRWLCGMLKLMLLGFSKSTTFEH